MFLFIKKSAYDNYCAGHNNTFAPGKMTSFFFWRTVPKQEGCLKITDFVIFTELSVKKNAPKKQKLSYSYDRHNIVLFLFLVSVS